MDGEPSNVTRYVLASASPRRRELLASMGLEFTTAFPEIDERRRPDEQPAEYALRLASGKAREVASAHHAAVVIGADTIVVADEKILDKPADAEEALEHLATLRGRWHSVATAVAVCRAADLTLVSDIEWSQVLMRDYGLDEAVAVVLDERQVAQVLVRTMFPRTSGTQS